MKSINYRNDRIWSTTPSINEKKILKENILFDVKMSFGDTIFLSLMTKMSFKTRFTIGDFIINPTRNEWDFNKHEEIPRVSGEISNRNPTSAQHEWDFDLKFHHSRVGFLSVCWNLTSYCGIYYKHHVKLTSEISNRNWNLTSEFLKKMKSH